MFLRSILIFISFFITEVHASSPLYPFATARQEAQFTHLLKDLRCLVCQNQDLSDSHAMLAQDLRNKVYEMVQEGKTDGEIITYLTQRYGDFILFNPPIKPVTWLLWFGPFFLLFLGLLFFLKHIYKKEVVIVHE